MTTEITKEVIVASKNEIGIWEAQESLKEIKEVFCPNLNDNEFNAYVGIGRSTGLNPFLKEIWAIKYDKSKPASIFIGRDGYRIGAQKNPLYEFHQCDAVYEGDEFSVIDAVPTHKYNLKDRGKLLGGYACVKLKNNDKAFFVYVDLKEYDKGQSNWVSMKATMIKKVAESQCFRMALQGMFGNTYHESEMDHVLGKVDHHYNISVNDLNESLGLIEKKDPFKIEQKYDMSKLCKEVNDSENLKSLEDNFKRCYKIVKDNKDHLNVLTEIKDKRKEEINQAETEEFKRQLGDDEKNNELLGISE